MRRVLAIVVFLGIFTSSLNAGEKTPSSEDVRKSIERSLPFIEKEGLAWIKKRDCMSCHVVSYMLWAHNEAFSRGIKVDQKKLDEWTEWSMSKSMGERTFFKLPAKAVDALPEPLRPKLKELVDEGFTHEKDYAGALARTLTPEELKLHQAALVKQAIVPKKGTVNDGGGVDTMWQLLLGRYAGASVQSDAFDKSTAEILIRWQEADGTWRAAGQLPSRRWARPSADQTTTMWSLLALANYRGDNPAVKKSLERGHAAVKKAKPDPNLEWLIVRYLYESKFGAKEEAASLRSELLKRQNADGGWSVTPDKASEAFSTGQSIYALSLGVSSQESAIANAKRFLLKTQQADGSWITPPASTSQGNADRLKKLEPIYRSWGTSWAAIGLSRTLTAK
jgi:Prenyltransferase and squalene oxidase repeat